MTEFDMALKRILSSLNAGEFTKREDWKIIFKSLVGADDAETICNVQQFILDNFSFNIEDGAEGIVYYGTTGATSDTPNAPIYMVVDTLVKGDSAEYGYISSTQAGRLFNEEAFNKILQENISIALQECGMNILYNGINNSGYIDGNIQSFNDFFLGKLY